MERNRRRTKKKSRKTQLKNQASNYEKEVRKFNESRRLCKSRPTANKKITTGRLKVCHNQDGIYLKGLRAHVRREDLSEGNKARKDEDINKIIDIGRGMSSEEIEEQSNEPNDVLTYLSLLPEKRKRRNRKEPARSGDETIASRVQKNRRKASKASKGSGYCEGESELAPFKHESNISDHQWNFNRPVEVEKSPNKEFCIQTRCISPNSVAFPVARELLDEPAKEILAPSQAEEIFTGSNVIEEFDNFTLRYDEKSASTILSRLQPPDYLSSTLAKLRALHEIGLEQVKTEDGTSDMAKCYREASRMYESVLADRNKFFRPNLMDAKPFEMGGTPCLNGYEFISRKTEHRDSEEPPPLVSFFDRLAGTSQPHHISSRSVKIEFW